MPTVTALPEVSSKRLHFSMSRKDRIGWDGAPPLVLVVLTKGAET